MLATPGPRTRRSPVSPRTTRQPARILVVEDDAEMRDWMVEMLEEEGFETLSAPEALSGVMTVLADGADLVVTDWRMPGYDGLRLLQSMRRIAPRVPVVFVTAYARPGFHEQIRAQGAFSLLEKPFRRDDLLLHVKTALQFGGTEPT